MKKILSAILVLSLAASLISLLSSCGDSDTITLNVYNWGEYISDGSEGSLNINEEFEKYYFEKYGVKIDVNYTTYDSNESMYSKISKGGSTYDVIIPSDYMIGKLIEDDLLYAFNPAETVENYSHIRDEFKDLYFDPDNMYSVPYTYGKVGIIYNSTLVDESDVADQSWALMWNDKYSGKILQFNNPRDAFGTAMYYLGIDVNTTDKAQWQQAADKLAEQKPLVQGYVMDEIFGKMTSASSAVSVYYAGDYLTMYLDNSDLRFYYPKEGTNVFVDSMCIPKNSENKEAAIEYINFLCSERIAVENAMYIGYASPNDYVTNSAEYKTYLEEEFEGIDAYDLLYGSEDVKTSYFHTLDADMTDYTNSLWENLKINNGSNAWVYIASGVIVVLIAGGIIYSCVKKKKRAKSYTKTK